MNYLGTYLPPRDMDPPSGGDLSDAAEQALAAHTTIQAEIFSLIVELKSAEGMMCIDRFDDLLGALEDAAQKPAEIDSMIYEEDEIRREDARMDAAEARWEARRDEEMGL